MLSAKRLASALQGALDAIQEADEICCRLSKLAFAVPADVHLAISNGLKPMEEKFHDLWSNLDRLQLLAEKAAEDAAKPEPELFMEVEGNAPSTTPEAD